MKLQYKISFNKLKRRKTQVIITKIKSMVKTSSRAQNVCRFAKNIASMPHQNETTTTTNIYTSKE